MISSSQHDSAQRVELEIRVPNNVYKYDFRNLVLAYGIALLVTTIAMLVGIDTMLSAGGSFDSNFTTLLRTTRDGRLADLVDGMDTHGFMPVPKMLGVSLVTFKAFQDLDHEKAYSFVPVNHYSPTKEEAAIEMVSIDNDSEHSFEAGDVAAEHSHVRENSAQQLIPREDSDLESEWRPSIDSDP